MYNELLDFALPCPTSVSFHNLLWSSEMLTIVFLTSSDTLWHASSCPCRLGCPPASFSTGYTTSCQVCVQERRGLRPVREPVILTALPLKSSKSLDKSLTVRGLHFLHFVEERIGLDALRGPFNFRYFMNWAQVSNMASGLRGRGEWCHCLRLSRKPTFSFLPYSSTHSREAYLTPLTWYSFFSGTPLTRCAQAPGSILSHSPPTLDSEWFSRSTLPTYRARMTARGNESPVETKEP